MYIYYIYITYIIDVRLKTWDVGGRGRVYNVDILKINLKI